VVLAVITIAATFVTPETRGRDLNVIADVPLDRTQPSPAAA
jgi:hypothetical protein